MYTQAIVSAHTHQAELRAEAEQWRLSQGRAVRRRSRRLAGLGAVPLGLTLAAGMFVALPPAPADAATTALSTVSRSANSVNVVGAGGTANDVLIFLDENNEMTVIDDAGIADIPGDGCSVFFGDTAKCGTGVTAVNVNLGDQADEVRAEAAVSTSIDAGTGDDNVFLGRVVGQSKVTYAGGDGTDTASYVNADRFVTVTLDTSGGDGRPGDNDNVFGDVERLIGTRFPDTLTGNDAVGNVLDGLSGPDTLRGLGGNDNFPQAEFADGADDISGGPGIDQVSYSQRRAGITVDLDGVADDGAAGEGDNVRGDIENIFTGSGDDNVTGSNAVNALDSGSGADKLSGLGGADALIADVESDDGDVDTILGGGGDDTIRAVDDVLDDIRCGAGRDTASIDSGLDKVKACESIGTN